MKKILLLFLIIFSLYITTNIIAAEQNHPSANKAIQEQVHQTAAESINNNEHHHGVTGEKLNLFWIIPFIGILLSIAIMPLVAPKFWHHHFGKVSLFWALVLALPYIFFFKRAGFYDLAHIYLIDYIPFIILLWSLFTISGGILLKGNLKSSPISNTIMLLIGTIFASWIGTTGASMVLIRPLIKANKNRKTKMHLIIFFIFLVSNIGGSLTPLGDPPLFLGFLHGVPFFWTLIHCFEPMLILVIILLAIYYAIDSYFYKKEKVIDNKDKLNIKLEGYHNFIFLLGVIGAVLLSGLWNPGIKFKILGVQMELQNVTRDFLMILMGIFSMLSTKKQIREDNAFTWFPIVEVAKLFAGIFVTIVPALKILEAGTKGSLDFLINVVKEPMHYFFVTGGLSSFLDNAPTYLTFYTSVLGKLGISENEVAHHLANGHDKLRIYLLAVSIGAVFMGANTYIGNAPNFMVKSIAEENGIKMPSFFGYMLWSIGILIPCFIIISLIFF